MNLRGKGLVLLSALLLGATAAPGQEPTPLPDTPVGRQTKQLLEVLATGSRDKIKAFVETSFAPAFLQAVTVGKHVDINARFARESGGVVVRQVVSATETSLRLLGEARKGGANYQIAVEVEAAPPHRL